MYKLDKLHFTQRGTLMLQSYQLQPKDARDTDVTISSITIKRCSRY